MLTNKQTEREAEGIGVADAHWGAKFHPATQRPQRAGRQNYDVINALRSPPSDGGKLSIRLLNTQLNKNKKY